MSRATIYLDGPACHDSSQHHLVPDAVVRGDMLFTGGVEGADPKTGRLPASHEEQAALVHDRLAAILEQTGFAREDIGHWFIWSPDRHSRIDAVNPHWVQWFPDAASRPARHAIARTLDPGLLYRIEVVGIRN